ncbi:hypothetical protein [Limnohabitans sp. DM1]|uniref:hypothetical protein n=1 Tax=Limnohabitans sp. DM1 TaxID=1597955 RepID=UPI000AA50A22|nr:hypothetical protein [Limnohabitans sp. DM1]
MKKSIPFAFILSTFFYSSICFAQDLKTTSVIKDSQFLANFENQSSQAIRINSVQVLSPTKSGVESKILKNIVVSLTLSPGSSAPISMAPVQLVRESIHRT